MPEERPRAEPGPRTAAARIAALAALAGCAMASSGCMTAAVARKAKRQIEPTEIVQVLEAAVADEAIYVRLALPAEEGSRIRERTLRLPLTSEELAPGKPGSSSSDGVAARLIPASLLLTAPAPDDASAVPIRRLSFDELQQSLETGAEGLELLVVTLTSDEASRLAVTTWEGERLPVGVYDAVDTAARGFLAIGGTGADGEISPLIDLYDGVRHQRGWYLLLPLTVPLDIVTSPVQAIVFLGFVLVSPP